MIRGSNRVKKINLTLKKKNNNRKTMSNSLQNKTKENIMTKTLHDLFITKVIVMFLYDIE